MSRMILRMKRQLEAGLLPSFTARFRPAVPRALICAFSVFLAIGLVFVSCASAPQYPASPPPLVKTVPVGFEDAFQATRTVMNEDARIFLHTVDKAGRLVAYEKTSGFIFFQHRTILDVKLESVRPEETRITMQMRAEDYEMGGLTRSAGWYPSAEVDIFLGEDIMSLIERKAAI